MYFKNILVYFKINPVLDGDAKMHDFNEYFFFSYEHKCLRQRKYIYLKTILFILINYFIFSYKAQFFIFEKKTV